MRCLAVAGNLDSSLGGPSADLTPAFTRRTVYGKVSRYKLDEYLQLFDFPSPNISAEKRFTTTVPLQRLFLMNSDFIQVEAEELAKRVAGEPDNRARIRKAYLLAYGRDPSEAGDQVGPRLPARRAACASTRRTRRPCPRGAGAAAVGDLARKRPQPPIRQCPRAVAVKQGRPGPMARAPCDAHGYGDDGRHDGWPRRARRRSRRSEVRSHGVGTLRQDTVQFQRIRVYQLS